MTWGHGLISLTVELPPVNPCVAQEVETHTYDQEDVEGDGN